MARTAPFLQEFSLAVLMTSTIGCGGSANSNSQLPAGSIHERTATLATNGTVNGLGTVHAVFDFGTYSPDLPLGPSNNWFQPGHNVKPPVALYQLNPNLVNTQLQNMRSSGIDVLVLMLGAGDLATCEANGSCNNGFNDGTWGLLLDDSQYALRPQMQQNLTAILQRSKALGFRKVVLRFGNYDPAGWTLWDESGYQRAWNYLANTRILAASVLANSATRLVIDLGTELIGVNQGQNRNYVQRLWIDYTTIFGAADTIGFSFVADASIVTAGISWLSSIGGVMPSAYAFDVYGDTSNGRNVGASLGSCWNALGSENWKPIMIMETYTNDGTTAAQVSYALAAYPTLNLTDIIQWPVTRAPTCSGCDTNIYSQPVAALGSTTQVSNYEQLANPVVTEDLTPSLLYFTDVNCAISTGTCTIQGHMGYQPTGAYTNWQVYVRQNDGPRALWGCNAGQGVSNFPWIDKSSTYRFDYYKVQTCSDAPTGAPDAISYLTFHFRNVQVATATYGGNRIGQSGCWCQTGNANGNVGSNCNGLASCNYAVYFQTLGDCCPGYTKDFSVNYYCNGALKNTYVAPEAGFGSVATLTCP